MSWFDLILLLMMLLMVLGIIIYFYFHPPVHIHVLPGGQLPQRQTPGAIGYDVALRALVSPREMELPPREMLRQTLFNFQNPPTKAEIREGLEKQGRFQYTKLKDRPGVEWVFWLRPGGRVTGGIGFVTAMPGQLLYWVSPRSGLASRLGVTLANAPGTVDSDYRGEACVVIVNNGDAEVALYRGMRIAQVIFQWAMLPRFIPVGEYLRLKKTKRGAGGLGSTKGFHG